MIDLTIKTLDSQNHAFSVEDDITVAQFKEKIAEVISIPVESQRLIHCGRVLQDSKKLQEYDVNGKVVHLVQRAPPSTTRRTRSPQHHENTTTRRSMQFPGGNAMYLGSMAFPSGLMVAQGIVQPPPTQSLSGSRLNVARRMIRRAENILNALEGGSRSRESPPEEQQDDVTPVFAAQVFVPSSTEDPLASLSAAVSAVENGIMQAEQTIQQPQEAPVAASAPEENATSTVTAEPRIDEPAASSASAENGENVEEAAASATDTGRGRSRTRGGLPRNSFGTIEMSRLLDDLNKVHERLQPYMERYHTFMRTDPTMRGDQDARETQHVINRVSEIMHLLGHAYHSLSDVMVQTSTPAPRPLLCRPILIQHSAVVQAGIPIQVEAQINLTPDRRPSDTNTSETPQSETRTTSETGSTQSPTTGSVQPSTECTQPSTESTQSPTGSVQVSAGFVQPPTGGSTQSTTASVPSNEQQQQQSTPVTATATSQQQPTITTSQVPPNIHEIRIDSFPFDFRSLGTPPVFNISGQPRGQQNAGGLNTGNTEPPRGSDTNPPSENATASFGNHPNMEFFMEVTPGSITIDSLETTVMTSAAQADNVLRGTVGGVPADFIQSLIQYAVSSEMMGAASQASAQRSQQQQQQTPSATNTGLPTNFSQELFSEQTETTVTATNPGSTTASNASNVNSQARGNTQTHPTTATQTRSTSRPHEHLAQHTMQGFDPFLPCNSHHIHRRRVPVTATTVLSGTPGTGTTPEQPTAGEQQNNNQLPNTFINLLQGVMRSFGHNVNFGSQQQPQQPQQQSSRERAPAQESSATATATSDSTAAPSAPSTPAAPPPAETDQMANLLNFADLTRLFLDNRSSTQGSTLASFLQNFPDHNYSEGESLFSDLVMTLAEGLTFGDVIALNAGQIDPLVRVRPRLRTFFRDRVLNGECPTHAAIQRGSNRLIAELEPVLNIMRPMRVRNNIDIVESTLQLCRSRLPYIISLLMSRMTGSLRTLVDQLLLLMRHLCALVLHCCEDGQDGVEQIFRAVIARYTVGISPDIFQWTIATSLTQLRHFLRSLDVPETTIQPFVVLKQEDNETPALANNCTETFEAEPMECEEAPVVETAEEPVSVPPMNATATLETDEEPLPNVVINSEPWHRGLSPDWIPIITRDSQRQRRQNSQPPFSDAYLSGMPSKRRKIVAASKPQGSLPQVISEGVRRAVTASGLTSTVPLDIVSQAAGADLTLQSAYRDLLRTSVQSELRDNPDFSPERFPNAANYFDVNK